jgi:AbrB family looped-hinge helix DNA binding protein
LVTEDASVTSKGQITIPKKVRERLGIGQGSEVSFILKDGEAAMLPKSDNPLEEMKKLRSEISFSTEEVDSMIEESKKAWDR